MGKPITCNPSQSFSEPLPGPGPGRASEEFVTDVSDKLLKSLNGFKVILGNVAFPHIYIPRNV